MVHHFINPSTFQIFKKINKYSYRRSQRRQETDTAVDRDVSSAPR
jgi:hypothetical protein